MSRLESLLAALERFYGALPAPPRDPFALFVWEVLSVHSTPKKRDAAFGALKRSRALTPDAMWRAPRKKLEDVGDPRGSLRRAAAPCAADRRGPVQAVAGSVAGDHRAATRRPPGAEGPAADGRGRGLSHAAVCRPIVRSCRSMPASAAWRGGLGTAACGVDLHEDRPLGAREPGARVAGDGRRRTGRRFSTCRTTARRPAPRPTLTARSVRSETRALRAVRKLMIAD